MLASILITVLGVLLTALLSSHALRRRWAIRRALARTPGATRALRIAIRDVHDELRPSAPSGEALLQALVEAMGQPGDEALASEFLHRLHKSFADRSMDVVWAPPMGQPRRLLPNRQSVEPQMLGRREELAQLQEWTTGRSNVVIRGAPGIGKTTLLEALNKGHPNAVAVRLEQGGQPLRDLRLALHGFCRGDFPIDDDQGIDSISRALPKDVLLLVDNVDESESASSVLRLVSHLPSLTVAVTSRGQSFPGFKVLDLHPLPAMEAAALLEDFDLTAEQEAVVLDRAKGNPLLLRQAGWAAQEGLTLDAEDRFGRLFQRFRGSERRVLWLVGEMPSSTLATALLVEVGHLTDAGLKLLLRNAVLKPAPFGFDAHETLRAASRELIRTVPREQLARLRSDTARFYTQWLAGARSDEIDAARPNLMHLISILDEPIGKADLALALIGDHLDDPRGYLPSRGLTRLLLEHRAQLLRAAEDLGGIVAAQLEKNLGLFSYWANESCARELLLSAEARYRQIDDVGGRAAATWILGYIADDSCYYQEAEALYRAPLEWLADKSISAVSHHLVGCSLYHQGRYDQARQAYLVAQATTQDEGLHARTERRLAYLELAAGDTRQALQQLEDARDHAKVLNRPRDVARVGRHVGLGWLQLGNLEAAEQELTTAKEAFAALGDERGLGSTMRNLATTRRLQGRLDEARSLALQSRAIARADPASPLVPMTSPFGAAAAEEELGRIASVLGDTASSIRHLRSACNIFEAVEHARSGFLARELGDHRDALIPEPRGIIFGLIDTLAEITGSHEVLEKRFSMAMGIRHDQFQAAWDRSRDRASTEPGWSSEDRIQWVAGECGVNLTRAVVEELAELEKVFWTSSVSLKPQALDLLTSLHRRKIKLAVVANSSNAMRGLPEELGLISFVQVSLLSCDVGATKPSKLIYEEALRRLSLSADHCIYVGNGNDRELDGAKMVGLFTVRLLMNSIPVYTGRQSLDWDATVGSLHEFALQLRGAKLE